MAGALLDDQIVRELYLGSLRTGMGRSTAAKLIGVRHKDVSRYVATHPEFAEDVADAMGEPVDALYEKAFDLGMDGDLEAIKFLLPKLDSERFGAKTVVEHKLGITLTDVDALRALTAQLEARQVELEQGTVIETRLALPGTSGTSG